MDLKQFVAETLNQIIEGVAEAQKLSKDSGAAINPARYAGQAVETHSTGVAITSIEFNVALSVSEGTGTKGGIAVVAGIFALGSQGESKESKASTTHVRFMVPIAFPALEV